MATFYSDVATNLLVNTPPVKAKVNRYHARLRIVEAQFTVPAGTAIGDVIVWFNMPLGARLVGHLSQLQWSAGAASSTLNLGDQASAARHLAATAVTTAGTAVPSVAQAGGALSYETTDASTAATNDCLLRSTVAGAGLQTGQVITLRAVIALD